MIIHSLLLVAGAAQLGSGWAGATATATLASAVLLPCLALPLAARQRVPLGLAVLGIVALVAGYGFAGGGRSGAAWLAVFRDGIPRLLTAPRPAPATVDLLLPGVLFAVLVGLWVGVRAAPHADGVRAAPHADGVRAAPHVDRDGGRRPYPARFAPLAGAAVLYVGGALLTAGRSDRHGLVAALIVACAVAGWSLPQRPRPPAPGQPAPAGHIAPGPPAPAGHPAPGHPAPARHPMLTRAAAPVAVVAAAGATVATVATATLVPTGGEFEPRHLVSPPPQSLVERNPLARLPALAERGDRELLRHTGGPGRLHLVALAEFDGAAWSAGARYRPVGAVRAAGLPGARSRVEITVDITIGALDGPWLPAPGTPTAVSLPGTRVDGESGSLVAAGGLRSGLRYRVRAWVDTPADTDLVVAGVAAIAPAAGAYLAVPRLPFLFAEYAQRVVGGAGTPFEQAVLIESAVRERGRLSTSAPAGSSYARLEAFLFGRPGTPGAQVGTSEQFATAFAVLARATGLPTRVVVGFRPGQRAPDGSWVVRGRDALAWPEVYFAGSGWVPFDPTPQQAQDAGGAVDGLRRQVLDRIGPEQPQPRPAPPVATQPAPAASPPPSPPAAVTGAGGIWTEPLTPLRLGRLAGTIVLVVLAAVALARARRRWRHRRAGARGAWSEVLDLLVLLGRRPAGSRTAPAVAADLAAGVPAAAPHPALYLAELADRAAFAPDGSPVGSPWPELRRLRRAVRRGVPWYRRLTWPVDPRPLVRR